MFPHTFLYEKNACYINKKILVEIWKLAFSMGMQVSYQGLGTILTSENDKIFIPTKFAEINKSTGYV
jgi:hypothetical protein